MKLGQKVKAHPVQLRKAGGASPGSETRIINTSPGASPVKDVHPRAFDLSTRVTGGIVRTGKRVSKKLANKPRRKWARELLDPASV